MIIDCPDCNKKFDIDQSLIPIDGRLLQCGACNYKWFFKLETLNENERNELPQQEQIVENKVEKKVYDVPQNSQFLEKKDKKKTNNKSKNKANYLNYILVVIISIIALILIMETFKEQLSSIIPNIKILLNNLYQSLEDIKLFIFDLIK